MKTKVMDWTIMRTESSEKNISVKDGIFSSLKITNGSFLAIV
jgi:hypothetical protein